MFIDQLIIVIIWFLSISYCFSNILLSITDFKRNGLSADTFILLFIGSLLIATYIFSSR